MNRRRPRFFFALGLAIGLVLLSCVLVAARSDGAWLAITGALFAGVSLGFEWLTPPDPPLEAPELLSLEEGRRRLG